MSGPTLAAVIVPLCLGAVACSSTPQASADTDEATGSVTSSEDTVVPEGMEAEGTASTNGDTASAATTSADASSTDATDGPETTPIETTLELTESAHSPLGAVANVTVSEPARVTLEFWSEGLQPLRLPWSDVGPNFELELVGMRAESTYTVRVLADLGDGEIVEGAEESWSTGAIPEALVLAPYTVTSTANSEVGITIVGPASPGNGGGNDAGPWLMGVDREGEVVWLYAPDDLGGSSAARTVEPRADGSLVLFTPAGVRAVTPGGETVEEVVFPPGLGVHHGATLLPEGGGLVLSEEVEQLPVPGMGVQPVRGDVVVRLDATGMEEWRWSTFDHLDTSRYPGPLSIGTVGPNDEVDWTHGNSLFFDEERGEVVLSLRHQNQVVAIDLESGSLSWVLGEDGDFSLDAGATWFTSQHAAEVRGDDVFLFDNANESGEVSRGVHLRFDGAAVEEVWSWEAGFFSGTFGDVDLLDNGNYLVAASGQREAGIDARVVEVTPAGDEVWEMAIGDEKWIFRAQRVPWVQSSAVRD